MKLQIRLCPIRPPFLLVLLFLSVSSLMGCGMTYVQKGSWEAEGDLELSTEQRDNNDFERSTFGGEVFLGAAATDNLQLGPALSFRKETLSAGDDAEIDSQDFLLSWRFRWNFPHEGFASPFVETDLGLAQREVDPDGAPSENSTELLYGIGAGMRFVFSESGAVILKAQYTHVDWDRDVGGDLDRWALMAGVSVKF